MIYWNKYPVNHKMLRIGTALSCERVFGDIFQKYFTGSFSGNGNYPLSEFSGVAYSMRCWCRLPLIIFWALDDWFKSKNAKYVFIGRIALISLEKGPYYLWGMCTKSPCGSLKPQIIMNTVCNKVLYTCHIQMICLCPHKPQWLYMLEKNKKYGYCILIQYI